MKFIISFVLIAVFLKAHSQDSLKHTFISQKYKGGIEAFIDDISSKLVYPQKAREAYYYTIAIVYLEIDQVGAVDNIEVINRLRFGMDKEIKKVFRQKNNNWLSSDSGYSLYLSITFSLYDNYAKIINVEYPEIIAENILITAFETGEDSLVRAKIDYRKEFQRSENGFNKNINKEYYKKAKSHLNRLIGMDPFYQEYYRNRLNIESYTKSYDYACGDLNILKELWNIKVKKLKVKCE